MSCDQSYPFPQVFLVDQGGSPQHSALPPNLIPCWSFPPAQERVRSRGKGSGFMGVSPCLAMIVLLLFLLVFAALGFEAYMIYNLQKEVGEMKQKGETLPEINTPQKQIGLYIPELQGQNKNNNNHPAAHMIGEIEKGVFRETLRWEPKVGRAFESGGVVYRIEDGSLQVNETGLYHIYSRVELLIKSCSPTSSFIHTVFLRRQGHSSPLTVMDAHRAGFCSQQPRHSWTSESYLGSVMKLRKHDRVFVNVSHPSYVSHAHYGNFFGLYKL